MPITVDIDQPFLLHHVCILFAGNLAAPLPRRAFPQNLSSLGPHLFLPPLAAERHDTSQHRSMSEKRAISDIFIYRSHLKTTISTFKMEFTPAAAPAPARGACYSCEYSLSSPSSALLSSLAFSSVSSMGSWPEVEKMAICCYICCLQTHAHRILRTASGTPPRCPSLQATR